MKLMKSRICFSKYLWTFSLTFVDVVLGYNFMKFGRKVNCLGNFCSSDPSLVLDFQLNVGCENSKPCVEARWRTSPNFDSFQMTKYILQYGIIFPESLRTTYPKEELTETSFTMDTHNKPAFGVIYEFRVAKYFKGKYGTPSVRNISLPESVPSDGPKMLQITELNLTCVIVSWEAPKPIYRNGIITSYEVRYYAVKNEEKTEKMVNVTETSLVVSNLLLDEYKIFVRAFTKAGAGIWSNPKYLYRPSVQDLPVPINVRVLRESYRELEIRWALPDTSGKDNKSSKIVGFVIFYSKMSLPADWKKHSTESTDLRAIIKGLLPSTYYRVKVAAVNSRGLNGNFSMIVEESTKMLPSSNSKAVRNLRCSVVNSKMLKLEWFPPMITSDIRKFEIHYSGNLTYTSRMNVKMSESFGEILKFVDFKANKKAYFIKLDQLKSNAFYTIKVRPIYNSDAKEDPVPSFVQTTCGTRPFLPDSIDTPQPLYLLEHERLIKFQILRSSERNGPLSNYTIVVGASSTRKNDQLPLLKEPDDYTFMELNINTRRRQYSGPYIAISKSVDQMFTEKGKNSSEEVLGDNVGANDLNSRAVNKRLEPHLYYKVFLRVCQEVQENVMCRSSNWSDTFNLNEFMNKKTVPSSFVKELRNKSEHVNYTVALIATLLTGVVLAAICIVIGCVIKQRTWTKQIIHIASVSSGIRSSDKCLLSQEMEIMGHYSKKYTTAPDLVTLDSILMCQDGTNLSPALSKLSHKGYLNSKRSQETIETTFERSSTAICNFYQYISDLKANNGALLQQEFEALNTNLDNRFFWQRSNIDCNKSKNRYANVVAYDHTSVLLEPVEDVIGSEYINANYIDGYHKPNSFIATQGPLSETTDDFWRMVWEQNCTSIVMMTKLEERSGVKCYQYWPNRGFTCYGQMIVCHMETISFAYYTIRVFELKHTKYTEKKEIHHFQFTAWPDHGVPKLSTPFLMFIQKFKSMTKMNTATTVVHCSAGVGRTGAFIVIESQLERIKHEKNIDVFNFVSKIRCQRNYMVQTQAQYMFILETLLESIEDGNTEVVTCNLHSHISKLSQIGFIGFNELSGFDVEFSKLSSVASNRDRHGIMLSEFVKAAGNQPMNLSKNKQSNIIPYDWNRVTLPVIRGIEGSDYINASYIDGYRDTRAYIAAQSPLLSSVEDFWRMIWEQHCGVVVVLNPTHESSFVYWPSHKSTRYQFFVVDPVTEYNMPDYILREFKITDARDGEFRTMRQFQFIKWPSHGCPMQSDSLLDFIRQVHKTKEQFGYLQPMIVHCSTGSGRTGVFVALSIVIDRLQQESVVDMYQTVKLLHKQRLGLVQTGEEYEFCHKAVFDYLSFYEKNKKICLY